MHPSEMKILTESLSELKIAANDICRAMMSNVGIVFSSEPVNWANLRCVTAREWIDETGTRGRSVLIEECSPEAQAIAQTIRKRLAEKGFHDIEIELAW